MQWIHGIFCGILFIIFMAMLSLSISVVVISVGDGAYSSFLYYTGFTSSLVDLQSSITKLGVAYNVLYMCFSLEVIVLAVILLINSLRQRTSKVVRANYYHAKSAPIANLIQIKGCSCTFSCRQLSTSPSLIDRSGFLDHLRPGRQVSHTVRCCRRGLFLLFLHGCSVCWCCVSALLGLLFHLESLDRAATSSGSGTSLASVMLEPLTLTSNSI